MNWSYTLPKPQAFTLPADLAVYDNDNRLQTWTPGGNDDINDPDIIGQIAVAGQPMPRAPSSLGNGRK